VDKTIIETEKANSNPMNSQATRKNNILFTSQKAAIDPVDGKVVGIDDIKAQTDRVIRNILAIVEAGGGTRKDIVKITVYLRDKNDIQGLNEVYKQYFPDALPARSLILTNFAKEELLVEMDAIAIVD
jgi:reactive intermediate/imine deaminase